MPISRKMLKRTGQWLGLVMALGLLSWLNCQPAQAANTGAGFTVQMVKNSRQRAATTGYFDLKVAPGQTGQVQMRVVNLTKQALHLQVHANTGYTTGNGIEAYDKVTLGSLSTAPYQLKSIFKVPTSITVPAAGAKVLTVPYQLPTKAFNGVLEGAFYFLNQATGETQATNQKGFQLHNRYALALGMVLRESDASHVKPALKLTGITTGSDQQAQFSPAVGAKLVNSQPQLLTHLKIDGRIYDQNGQLKFKTVRQNLGMAPNSNFTYLINTGNKRLAAGQYKLRLVATAKHQRWVFTRTFKVSKAQADKVNQQVPRDWHWLWWVLLALAILLIILLLWLVYRYGQRKGREQAQ